MVTIYLKNGKEITIREAMRAEFSTVPDTMISRLVCYDANGKEVASFMIADISGHHVIPDQGEPSIA